MIKSKFKKEKAQKNAFTENPRKKHNFPIRLESIAIKIVWFLPSLLML